MGKGGVAIAAQKKRDDSYTVAEPAAGGSLKRVRRLQRRPSARFPGPTEFGVFPTACTHGGKVRGVPLVSTSGIEGRF